MAPAFSRHRVPVASLLVAQLLLSCREADDPGADANPTLTDARPAVRDAAAAWRDAALVPPRMRDATTTAAGADAAARLDAGVDAAIVTGAQDSGARDSGPRDSGPRDGAGASCPRPTCGGTLVGSWTLISWCSGVEGTGPATGTLTFHADGTYSWTITAGPPRLNAKPTAEVGTWRVEKNELVTKVTTSNGASFPPRGSLLYRGDLGARAVFCVDADQLTVRAEEKVRFNWTLRRTPPKP